MGSKPIGISGSRAAIILGLNDYQTELELWQRIMEEHEPGFNSLMGYVLPEDPDNASIRWGTAFEDSIVKLAEEKAGLEIVEHERLYHLKNYLKSILGKYITCHIDGFYFNSSDLPFTLHEGKTSAYYNWKDTYGTPGTDKVPSHIQCQVQHQLLCTGADKCIVSVLVFPKRPDEWEEIYYRPAFSTKKGYFLIEVKTDKHINIIDWATVLDQMGYFHQYPIHADPDLHEIMIEKYKEWWQKHIIKKLYPVPRNTDDIKRLFPEPVGTIVADGNMENLVAEYKAIGQEISKTGRLGKRREEVKVIILDWMRKQDPIIDDDSREKTILRGMDGKKLVSWNGKVFR